MRRHVIALFGLALAAGSAAAEGMEHDASYRKYEIDIRSEASNQEKNILLHANLAARVGEEAPVAQLTELTYPQCQKLTYGAAASIVPDDNASSNSIVFKWKIDDLGAPTAYTVGTRTIPLPNLEHYSGLQQLQLAVGESVNFESGHYKIAVKRIE